MDIAEDGSEINVARGKYVPLEKEWTNSARNFVYQELGILQQQLVSIHYGVLEPRCKIIVC
jgi:hypothetical protein